MRTALIKSALPYGQWSGFRWTGGISSIVTANGSVTYPLETPGGWLMTTTERPD